MDSYAACTGDSTVVVGGGVIGLATAYYLAVAQRRSNSSGCIYVVDSSSRLFAGASGQATGILHYDDFTPEANPMGAFSWELHKQLASAYNGRLKYGFSDLTAYIVSHKKNESVLRSEGHHGLILPRWFRDSDQFTSVIEPYNRAAGRLDSFRFCEFLLQQCKALGVEVLLDTKITGIEYENLCSKTTSSVTLQQTSIGRSIPCHSLVIAAGPWSQRVLASLFPSAQITIPMDTVSTAGNHLTVRTPGWKPSDDENPCQQVILDEIFSRPLDISSLLGGTLYIGSYGAEPEELPDLATQIRPQPEAIQGIKNLCRRALKIPVDEALEIVREGRCYRPVVKQGHPIIAEVPLSLLKEGSGSLSTLRVFFNTGHGSYGITQGPGSGKLMSELIMGEKLSVNISGLGYE